MKKYSFRFICVYSIIYTFPFPLTTISQLEENVLVYYNGIWKLIVPWIGENILHLPYAITIFQNGSGDTTFNYVQVLIFFVLSIVISLSWTLFDYKRINYKKLSGWLKILIRYYLAYHMLSYGLVKVFYLQFPFPSAFTLSETYGESSPMRLI